jgi:hypothetical protein
VRLLTAALVVLLAGRTLYLGAMYVAGVATARRHHVEASALAFAGVAFVHLAVRAWAENSSREDAPSKAALPLASGFALWACFVVAAFALYWPSLFIGLLSDDYVLIENATRWHIFDPASSLFRPLPLLLWSLLWTITNSPVVLHAFNVMLHGTNAYLMVRASEQSIPGYWSVAGGVLFVVFPLSVEAVSWNAGVFDLLMTTLLLTSVVIARRYWPRPERLVRAVLAVGLLSSLFAKETAVIGALFVGIAVLRPGGNVAPRALIRDLALLLTAAGIFGLWRFHMAGEAAPSVAVTRYILQKALFIPFGALNVPWHVELQRHVPLLPIAFLTLVIVVLTSAILLSRPHHLGRVALAHSANVVVAIIPVITFLYVAADLGGSRYMYLPSVAWVMLLVAGCSSVTTRAARRMCAVVVMVVCVLCAYGVRWHVRIWSDAALVRDRVLAAAAALDSGCASLTLSGLPDSHRGVYLFRVGAREAFIRGAGVTVNISSETMDSCTFAWNDDSGTFVRMTP